MTEFLVILSKRKGALIMMRWKDKKEWLQGLTEDQVKESAAKYGVNELE